MKIGVFLCQCGPNISARVDLEEVARAAAAVSDVTLVKQEGFPCSPAGKEVIKAAIAGEGLTHVVFAACSHREHEKTFARLCEDAGLNPYMMEMANIREHCAWMIDDREKATERAVAQVRAAIAKVRYNQPLTPKTIDVNPAVAVIGGGIAGMKAANLAARDGRQVYLIEKTASVGGKMPQWEKSYPTMDCNPCFLTPEIEELKETGNITLIDSARIEEIVGFYGSFTLTVRQAARGTNENCMACGECSKACPVTVANDFNYGLDERAAIYLPFPGSLPGNAKIDASACLRRRGEECTKCAEACMFEAVDYSQTDTVHQLAVGAIIVATGFSPQELADRERYAAGLENVITSPQLERLISSTGPTQAHLILANGEAPRSVTIVNCAGRDGYCSRVCCAVSLKYAAYLTEHYPAITVTIVHHDLCLAGDGYQNLYEQVKENDRVAFYQMRDYRDISVAALGDTRTVSFTDVTGLAQQIQSDLVVLSVGMAPSTGQGELLEMLAVDADRDGFVAKNHARMDPNMAGIEGIFIAGCCSGPKDEQETVISAEGAAAQVISRLREGEKITLEVITAYVDEEQCSGCRACIGVCPYRAISYNEEKGTAEVSEILCKGCGTCVAACPSGAMKNHHFDSAALREQLAALIG